MTAARWTWRRLGFVALAAVGASLLAVIVARYWSEPNDNLAYWLAASELSVAGSCT